MSFALTTPQIESQVKDVTRRMGWEFLQVGDLLRPVKKCMGLKKGEAIEQIGKSLVRVVDISKERLDRMMFDVAYGFDEIRREGFRNHPRFGWPDEWINFFCASHKGCAPSTVITRIEFEYVHQVEKTN